MQQSRPHPLLFALQDLVVDMALINRYHYLAKQDRSENDIEHSFAVAMLCWYVHDRYRLDDLDLAKIFKYALVHDFAERYAGDTNTYGTPEERAQKVEREKLAYVRLHDEFKEFDGLVKSMQAYEDRKDPESLFVWTVDKMQSLIMADLDDWRPYRENGITYDRFVKKHSEQLATGSPHCKEIFTALLEYCKTTVYDKLEQTTQPS